MSHEGLQQEVNNFQAEFLIKQLIKVIPLLPTCHGVQTWAIPRVIRLKASGLQEENNKLEHHRSQLKYVIEATHVGSGQ